MEALEFLIDIRDRLGNMADDRYYSVNSYFSVDSCVKDREESNSPTKGKSSKSYKYANVGKDEIMGIMDEGKTQIDMDTKLGSQKKLSDNILILTGIWDYISQIPENTREPRIMYGFLGKPNRTALKIEK